MIFDIKESSQHDWLALLNEPDSVQLAAFHDAKEHINFQLINTGFRKFSAELLSRNLIDMSDYVSIFGGYALYHLSPTASGQFCNDTDPQWLTEVYSRAKYGGVNDIHCLAKSILDYLYSELNNPCSSWSSLFQQAKKDGEQVVLMTTGWRNVPSTANVLYDIVVENVNIKLAHMGYPTIINVKLPRIAPPCENYASLSYAERERVNLIQDHVIPAENFYRFNRVHVIFGDDVLVTGATADKLMYESLNNGAKSFRSIYAVAIDPRVGLNDASIEERLNSVLIKQRLDGNIARMLSDSEYQPILRTLRLLFGEESRDNLHAFFPKVPLKIWLRLYVSALNNEFLAQPDSAPSLVMLRDYLTKQGILNDAGMAIQSKNN